jgi:hypothetical protein
MSWQNPTAPVAPRAGRLFALIPGTATAQPQLTAFSVVLSLDVVLSQQTFTKTTQSKSPKLPMAPI